MLYWSYVLAKNIESTNVSISQRTRILCEIAFSTQRTCEPQPRIPSKQKSMRAPPEARGRLFKGMSEKESSFIPHKKKARSQRNTPTSRPDVSDRPHRPSSPAMSRCPSVSLTQADDGAARWLYPHLPAARGRRSVRRERKKFSKSHPLAWYTSMGAPTEPVSPQLRSRSLARRPPTHDRHRFSWPIKISSKGMVIVAELRSDRQLRGPQGLHGRPFWRESASRENLTSLSEESGRGNLPIVTVGIANDLGNGSGCA